MYLGPDERERPLEACSRSCDAFCSGRSFSPIWMSGSLLFSDRRARLLEELHARVRVLELGVLVERLDRLIDASSVTCPCPR